MANDFFKNVKKQELEIKETKKIEESTVEEVPKQVEEKKLPKKTVEKELPINDDKLTFYLPKKGRPVEYNGPKHQLCLQLREDFYDLARKKAETDFNKSVTRYIHYLIAKDNGLL